ncbi:MAG TPA: DNA polymerase III subunit delta [bacterium]|nr:DNA polymerase III subunit delta [bacterium]
MDKPVIQLLINNEEFLCRRHLKHIEKKIIDEGTKDFNLSKVSAQDLSVGQLIDLFNTLPMMATYRTVIVRAFDEITKNNEAAKKEAATLADYFLNPNPSTHIIMICSKIDKRTTLYKNIAKQGDVIEFKPLYADKVPAFVAAEAKAMGLVLERGCAEQIAEVVGLNLMSIVTELEKLAVYVLPEKRVTLKQVGELICFATVDNVFLLSEHIACKAYAKACEVFDKMCEQGEPVVKTTSLVITHFRKLMLLKSAQQECLPESEWAGLLGVHSYFIKKYEQQANAYQVPQLKRVYGLLMEASVQLRTLSVSDGTVFETFLQKVCVG